MEHLSLFRCDSDTYKAVDVIPLELPLKNRQAQSDNTILHSLEVATEVLDVFPDAEGRMLSRLAELEEFKRDLYLLAEIGNEMLKTTRRGPEDECRPLKELILYPDRVLALEIMYSYTWARRSDELTKLKSILKRYGLELLKYPDDIVNKSSVLEALRVLLSLKPIADLVILALRRREAVEPSNFVQVKR